MKHDLIINEQLKALESSCITALLQKDLSLFEEKYRDYEDYAEFIFSVLDYNSGNYATEIGLDGNFTNFLDSIFNQHSDIIREFSKNTDFDPNIVRNIFYFHLNLIKYAKSKSDASSTIDWHLASYFRFQDEKRNKNSLMLKTLLETHEQIVGSLKYIIRLDTEKTSVVKEAHIASIKRLCHLYLHSIRHGRYEDSEMFRDAILYWPKKIKWSYEQNQSYYDSYDHNSFVITDTHTAEKAEQIYPALYNFQKDLILLTLFQQIKHVLENNDDDTAVNEIKNLLNGISCKQLSNNDHGKPFENASELLTSYFRALFLYENDYDHSPNELYTRLLTERKHYMMGRVYVESPPTLANDSIRPFILLALLFDFNNIELCTKTLSTTTTQTKENICRQIDQLTELAHNLQQKDIDLITALRSNPERQDAYNLQDRLGNLRQKLEQLKNSLSQDIDNAIIDAKIDESRFYNYSQEALAGIHNALKNHAIFRLPAIQQSTSQKTEYKETILTVSEWNKKYVLDEKNELYSPIDSSHFFESIGEHLAMKAFYMALIDPIINYAQKIEIPSGNSEEYWLQLKNILNISSHEEYILFLDNRTRPRHLYEWTNKYRSPKNFPKPDNFILTEVKEYKDTQGYIGTINNRMHIIYAQGFVEEGTSLVVKKSSLKEFGLQKNNSDQEVNITLKYKVDKSGTSITLKFICYYGANIAKPQEAYLINHGEKPEQT